MTLLSAALDDLFADPNLAQDAFWRASGLGTAVPVRVILRRPDRAGDFGETRLVAPAILVELRTAEVPSLAEGDTIEVDGVRYLVQGAPMRDGARLVWTAALRETP
ncbi:MAG: hypothetical protein IRY94_12345 [Rhodospirillaceae bacterium]|nr:hypothetical protein [Rhodospirillaceae bacterium]